MKEEKHMIDLFQIMVNKLKSDIGFMAYYLEEYDEQKWKCSEKNYQKLCMCRYHENDKERLKIISDYTTIPVKTILANGKKEVRTVV